MRKLSKVRLIFRRAGGEPDFSQRRVFRLLAWGLWLIYLVLLCSRASLSATGSDSSGYLNAARLLTQGKLSESVEPLRIFGLPQESIRIFIPLGFSPGARPGTMVPSYPLGLPLQMAAAALVGGWTHAPFWIGPLSAAISLFLIYAVGREFGMKRGLAFASAALLAAFPTFLWIGLQPLSDVPATTWALAAMVMALRARRNARAAYLCGAAFGIAVLVRPTNSLLVLPLLLALPFERRILLRFVLGGFPFAAFLFTTNQIANGNPFRSGYGDVLGGLSVGYFAVRIRHYAFWLSALGTPLLVLGWMAVAGVRSLPRRDRLILILWPAVFLIFYCLYQPYDTWWYTRFLLPGVPAMILALLLVADRGFSAGSEREGVAGLSGRHRMLLAVALSTIIFATGIYWTRRYSLLKIARSEQIYPLTCRWAAAAVPQNSVIAAMQMTGALKYYTDSISARLDQIDASTFPILRSRVEWAGYRWYALVNAENDTLLLRANLPGSWKPIGRMKDQTLLRLESPGDGKVIRPPRD